jgi:quercetin dioxygenase-like cupin family protein
MDMKVGRILRPSEGRVGSNPKLGEGGMRFMLDAVATGGGVALVEGWLGPRTLAAPLHRHTREDEYTYVLEGSIGALLGDEFVLAKPGDLIIKPRHQWHTLWNAGDEPARALEIICPAGMEAYLAAVYPEGDQGADPETVIARSDMYGITMDPTGVPELVQRLGLRVPD